MCYTHTGGLTAYALQRGGAAQVVAHHSKTQCNTFHSGQTCLTKYMRHHMLHPKPCRLTDGLQEDDLLGPDVREPFRAMTIHLAQHIHDVVVAVGVDNPQAVQVYWWL